MIDTYFTRGDKIGNVEEFVFSRIDRIRLGVYSEEHDGDLLTVLEGIERILR